MPRPLRWYVYLLTRQTNLSTAVSGRLENGGRSEADAQADGRVDVLRVEVAIRETAPHIRDHHAAIAIDSLDRLVVDHERSGADAAGALAAADVDAGARAGAACRGQIVILSSIVDARREIEIAPHRIPHARPLGIEDPVDVIGVGGRSAWGHEDPFGDSRKAVGVVVTRVHEPGVVVAGVKPELAPCVARHQFDAGAVRQRRLQHAVDVVTLRRTAAIARQRNGVLGLVDDAVEREIAEVRADLSLVLAIGGVANRKTADLRLRGDPDIPDAQPIGEGGVRTDRRAVAKPGDRTGKTERREGSRCDRVV